MKKTKLFFPLALLLAVIFIGCAQPSAQASNSEAKVYPTKTPSNLPSGLTFYEVTGDDNVTALLSQGGLKATSEAGTFFTGLYSTAYPGIDLMPITPPWAGCSAFLVSDSNGGYYAGRNFDWGNYSAAVIIRDKPSNGDYASVCTFNKQFVTYGGSFSSIPENVQKEIIAKTGLFVPMDGFNEKGLCVFVLNQEAKVKYNLTDENTSKPDLTLTSAVRVLLNKAKTVDEAVNLLKQYDMHSDIQLAHHLFVADANGKSAAIEWDNTNSDESKRGMRVTETKVLANHPLYKEAEISSSTELQTEYSDSLTRYNAVKNKITEKNNVADFAGAKEIIHAGHQDSSRWSIIYHITKDYTEETLFWAGSDGKWKSTSANWDSAEGYVVSAK